MILTAKTLQLILDYEVGGGRAYYDKKLFHPTWPGGDSGITIGIGYDLGFCGVREFAEAWIGLDDEARDKLADVVGLTGHTARMQLPKLRGITVPYDLALYVFQRVTWPSECAKTLKAFPGVETLPETSFGALVSLVYNRGPGMSGPRRLEMRRIRNAVQQYAAAIDSSTCKQELTRLTCKHIAAQIREMKRLWVGQRQDGLLRRRDAEAKLVESCE